MKKSEVSIVIPVFNEARNIEILTNKIIKSLNIFKFEIIFVDDNSQDNSKKILKNLKKKYFFFKPILRNKFNRDLTQSCFEGIEKSTFEKVVIMDGDLQHDPNYIPKLYKKLNKEIDIVVGTRNFLKGRNPGLSWIRKQMSKILIFMFSIISNKTKDPMSGFFIFKKYIYFKNKKKFYGKGFKILIDLIINSEKKLNVLDFDIVFKRRLNNKSKMNIKIMLILIKLYIFSFINKFILLRF
tara:strand:- start:12 stop:731 length:720 start_codon:yes stop_codon:yes gene_type:complete